MTPVDILAMASFAANCIIIILQSKIRSSNYEGIDSTCLLFHTETQHCYTRERNNNSSLNFMI